jgi:succinate dehydrogenase flavin-adding protein (antitoxin of CptAB toxin-antitoxin module)
MKRLVEISDIKILLNLIEKLKFKSNTNVWNEFDNIIDFIEDNILKVEQEEKNQFKRAIYKRMKETKGEENKNLYKLYHEIDDIFNYANKYKSKDERKAIRMLELLEKIENYGIKL